MTATRLRIAAQCATSLTLAAIACVVGQAGGTWWAVLLFALAAVTVDGAVHMYEQGRRLRMAQRVIIRLHTTSPSAFAAASRSAAAGLARLRADVGRPSDSKETDRA